MIGKIISLDYNTCKSFLLPKHYSGRMPPISYGFGWIINGILEAVCTFGKPASDNLCKGICGNDFSSKVYELNRLCRNEKTSEPLSNFVAACLRRLKPYNLIIVSYSDTDMHHHGYVYQACNFIYTGMTKSRTVKYTPGNKHSRHYNNDEQKGIRKIRSAKHRYVYFAMDKTMKRKAYACLHYQEAPYPKGDNQNYILGEYLKPKLINSKEGL